MPRKLLPSMWRHVFFLSDFLSLDAVPQVKLSQACHGNSLVGKLSMEQDGPPLKRFACPSFKSRVASQKVDVFLAQLTCNSFWLLCGFQCLAANMLHSIVGEVQGLRNRTVGDVFIRGRCGIRTPESEKQNSHLYFCLLLLRIFQQSLH